jgi:hypothetical protein
MPSVLVAFDAATPSVAAADLTAVLRKLSSEIWSATTNVYVMKTAKSPEAVAAELSAVAPETQVLIIDVTRDHATAGYANEADRWLRPRL